MSITGGRVIFPSKKRGELFRAVFDFAAQLEVNALGSGESITSSSVTASVYSGVDPTPALIISGVSAVASTSQVGQNITQGVQGCIYNLLCTANTNQGRTYQMAGLLAIEADLGGAP